MDILKEEEKVKMTCGYAIIILYLASLEWTYRACVERNTNILNMISAVFLLCLASCWIFYGIKYDDKYFLYPNLVGIFTGIIYLYNWNRLRKKYGYVVPVKKDKEEKKKKEDEKDKKDDKEENKDVKENKKLVEVKEIITEENNVPFVFYWDLFNEKIVKNNKKYFNRTEFRSIELNKFCRCYKNNYEIKFGLLYNHEEHSVELIRDDVKLDIIIQNIDPGLTPAFEIHSENCRIQLSSRNKYQEKFYL